MVAVIELKRFRSLEVWEFRRREVEKFRGEAETLLETGTRSGPDANL